MTYKQAYDKILDAYFADEIKPLDARFCFCGTLSPNEYWEHQSFKKSKYPYTVNQYWLMEAALFKGMSHIIPYNQINNTQHPLYEAALFQGLSDALDVLRSIHELRGEIIDDQPAFTKRNKLKVKTT